VAGINKAPHCQWVGALIRFGTRIVVERSEDAIKFKKEDTDMKSLLKKFETMMVAAAFAEEGEYETARQIMNEDRPRNSNRPSARDYQKPTARKVLRAD
jgi:hypothetical protein